MGHKKQHTIPQTYLRAWTDPNTPSKQTPYVWMNPLDGSEPRNKAPAKIFHETDFYTITLPDGSRNLTLEEGLSGVENMFALLRRNVLLQHKPLSDEDRLGLCLFTAAMYARTTVRADRMRPPLQQMLEETKQIQERLNNASEEEQEIFRKQNAQRVPPPDNAQRISLAQLNEIADRPMQVSLQPTIAALLPFLLQMQPTILETSMEPGFITSDNPCCIYDPNTPKLNPGDGIPWNSQTLEVTLPLSPQQFLLLSRQEACDNSLYHNIDDNPSRLGQLNLRTKRFAKEYTITNQRLDKK